MKKKTNFSRLVAVLTAFLLALTPIPFGETGISGGVGISASAEEADSAEMPSDDGETTDGEDSGSDDGNTTDGEDSGSDDGETTDGEASGSDDGETTDGGENGSDDGETTDGEESSDNGDEPADDDSDGEWESVWFNDDTDTLPDSDELFNEYVNRVFYGETGLATFDNPNYGYKSLTDEGEKEVYNALKPLLIKIANGKIESTVISVTTTNQWVYTKASMKKIHVALLSDLPYALYWYDKTVGVGVGYSTTYTSFTFAFTPAQAYAGSEENTVDISKTSAASKSAANANSIVEQYKDETDYEKLTAYRDELCRMVEYNHAAVDDNYPYGDPWQLIYAFDNDPTTNIVCEGYSKAYQYLCDLTKFKNSSINCALVSGTMSGGDHMWNIVSIDGVSYLVDITNTDAGDHSNGYLFLNGVADPTESGFNAYFGSRTIRYVYNDNTKNQYSSKFLTLSTEDYTAASENPISCTVTLNSDELYFRINGKVTSDRTLNVKNSKKVEICADTKDYIFHNELSIADRNANTSYSFKDPMEMSGDSTYFSFDLFNNDLLSLSDTTDNIFDFTLGGDGFSETVRANFTKLVLDDGVTVYPLSSDGKADRNTALANGDYVQNGFWAFIAVDSASVPDGGFISVNGVKADAKLVKGEYQITDYGCPRDENGEFVVRIVNGGCKYKCSNSDIIAAVGDKTLSDGDLVEDGTKIIFKIKNGSYINKKLVINGEKAAAVFNNESNTYFSYEYTVSGASVEAELADEQWSDEELAKFVKVEIGDNISAGAFVNDTVADWLSNGDYYPRGAYIKVYAGSKAVKSGKKLLVNGEAVELTAPAPEAEDSDYTYICKVDPKGDTLTIEFSSAVTVSFAGADGSTERHSFDNVDAALKYISKSNYNSTDVTLIINNDMTIEKLAVPKNVHSFTLTNDSNAKVSFNMSALAVPVDTTLNITGDGENLKPITISVAAGKTLDYDGFTHYGGGVTVKGTKTSVLNINGFLTLSGISTFGEVNVADGAAVSVEGNVAAVTTFNGALWLKDPKYSAAVTNFGKGTVRLYDVDGKNAKVTLNDITEALTVELVDPNTTIKTKISSGRTILYAGSTKNFTDKITVANTNTSDQELNAYLYGKEIRAEYGGAVSLFTNGGKERKYPNLDLAIADMNEEASYTIVLNESVTVSKLTLPKKPTDITFESGSGKDVLLLNFAALTIPVDTTFNIRVAGVNSKPTAITVGANAALTINSTFANIGAVKGTKTSTLNVNSRITAASLATFEQVDAESGVITVTGNVSGIAMYSGELKLPNAKSTAAVTTADRMYLDLVEAENGAVAKVTVSNVSENSTEDNTGILIRVIDSESGSLVKLTGGKTVLWSAGKSDFTQNVRIENISTQGHELSPFLYGKEIRAEYAKAIKVDDGTASNYYPNIDSAFKDITDAAKSYTVYLNEDVAVSKLVLPKKADFIAFTGSGSLELNMTALTIPVDTQFGAALKGTNAKPLALTVSAGKTLTFSSDVENIGAVKGTKTSSLYVNSSITAASVSTFGDVVAIGSGADAVLTVTGNISGVTNLGGTLALPNIKSAAAFVNAEDAVLKIADVNGMSAKVTVTNVVGDSKLKVVFVDEDGEEIGLGAGKTILWLGGKTDISDRIELVNKAEFGNAIDINVYGKEVRADCGNAVTVNNSASYPSIEAAFKAISSENASKSYTVTLNESVSASKLTFPKKAEGIIFNGKGSLNLNMTSLAVPVYTEFNIPVNGTNAKPLAISVAAGKELVFNEGAFVSNIGAVKGGKNSVFINSEINTVGSVSSFNVVYASQLLNVTGNVSGIDFLKGFVGLPNAKSTMTVSYIWGETTVGLTDNNGSFAKVTVKGMYDEESMLIMSVVDEESDPIMLPSGKTILWSNGKYDFTEQVAFVNESASGVLTAKLVGKEIKAVNENAVTLTADGNPVGSYATIEEAFANVKNAKLAYTITLNDDVYAAKFTLPTKAASLTITGADRTLWLNNVSAVTAAPELTVEGITFKNTKAFTLSAKKNLTLKDVRSDCLTAVKGTSKYTYTGINNDLTFTGKNGTEPTKITGFQNTAKK